MRSPKLPRPQYRPPSPEEEINMKLTEIPYDRIREASVVELCDIAEMVHIQDDERLRDSEDLRERIILMKKKMEGCNNIWKPMFRSVQEETTVKIESLLQLMKTVDEIFETFPTESLSEILKKEGHIQSRNLVEEISTRMKNLTDKRSIIVVAGETNGGKSTFLNLLLGEDILPTDFLHCTFAVCKIVYSEHYSIKTLDHNDIEENFLCSSRDEVKDVLINAVTKPDHKEREFESNIKEITLGIPADILKSGVVLVDTPGIGENEAMDNVTMNFVKSTHASAFIYIIKSDTAGGIQEDRLLSFLKAIKERYSSDTMMETFDPRAAMFVCHRWDNIGEDQREKVRLNALKKLEYVWPRFDSSQTYFFSSTDTMKHLQVDPDFVTDNFMVLLKGIKQIFDRASHTAIKHQYIWLKYMLQPTSQHLKSMITNCIMSNEELEEYFTSVAGKQNRLMVSSVESSRILQTELDKMSWELRKLISSQLNFDSISPSLVLQDFEEIIKTCSKENFFANQKNRQALDDMIVSSLLKHVDDFVNMRQVMSEMETKILVSIRDHLGLFKCQVDQIKHDMLHGLNRSQSAVSLEMDDSINPFGATTESSISSASSNSSIEVFRGAITLDPSQLSQTVRGLLLRRKEGKTIKKTTSSKQEIRQSLLSKIGERIKYTVMSRPNSKIYVEDRVRKISKDIREKADIINSIMEGYTEWIQKCVNHAVDSIPKFIEVNTKLMEEIRDHRTIFQKNKALLIKAMEDLEPCRHLLKGYGLLYMDDINAETLSFNTEHRTSTVTLPKQLISESGRSTDLGFRDSAGKGLLARMTAATIKMNDVANRVIMKTYLYDMDEKMILPEIASLRCLDYSSLAPFLGMTRISIGNSGQKPLSSNQQETTTEKVSAFIFKGDLVSASVYSTRRKINLQDFIPNMIQSLLRGLNYIHREGLVHLELSMNTVMVDRVSGAVKLCQMCKPREATFPEDLEIATKSYVCLSPSSLQGNVYESTDDIYAFGLLLWEVLNPDHPPYKDQRLWTLKRFIEKCHPSNMLHDDLYDLDVSRSVHEVLKGTLLLSRGDVCMSIATIQSFLADLDNESALMRLRPTIHLGGMNIGAASLPAPVVKVTSPSGTGKKFKFIFDETSVAQDEPSSKNTDPWNILSNPDNSTKISSTGEGKHNSVGGNRLQISQSKRRLSAPDIRIMSPPPAKPKSKTALFFNTLFKIRSPRKSIDEDVKQPEGKATYDPSRRRSSVPGIHGMDFTNITAMLLPQESTVKRRSSVDRDLVDSDIISASVSKNTDKEISFDPSRQTRHKSLPNQASFGPQGFSLVRKNSVDVPVLFEKYRSHEGDNHPKDKTSRLKPLSSLRSELFRSGSSPSLYSLTESTSNDSSDLQKRQSSTASLANNPNPGIQIRISPVLESKTRGLTIPQEASSVWKLSQRYGGSMQDLSRSSVNSETSLTDSAKRDRNSSTNLHDKETVRNMSHTSPVPPPRRHKPWLPRQPSPLTVSHQIETPLPPDTFNQAKTTASRRIVDNNPTLYLSSSSSSSHEPDSGFCTDTSGRGITDLLDTNDNLLGSIAVDNSVANTESLHNELHTTLTPHKTQNIPNYNNVQMNIQDSLTTNIVTSEERLYRSSLFQSNDVTTDDNYRNGTITRDLSLENQSGNTEQCAHENVQSTQNDEACQSNRNKSIMPPLAPINFSELSF